MRTFTTKPDATLANISDHTIPQEDVVCKANHDLILPNTQEVVSGLAPGDVGVLIGPADLATTLMRNLTYSLDIGNPFVPFREERQIPLKVVYLDFVSSPENIEADRLKMLESQASSSRDAITATTYSLRGFNEPWFTNVKQLDRSSEDMSLLIVDSIQPAFRVLGQKLSEEFFEQAISRLRNIANWSQAAVLVTTGGELDEDAQRALSTHCDLVLTMTPISDGSVHLSCIKSRSGFKETALWLDNDKRWFHANSRI